MEAATAGLFCVKNQHFKHAVHCLIKSNTFCSTLNYVCLLVGGKRIGLKRKIVLNLFPQVVQKHNSGKVGNETRFLIQIYLGIFPPKIIEIEQCLTKLRPSV